MKRGKRKACRERILNPAYFIKVNDDELLTQGWQTAFKSSSTIKK